MRRACKPRGPIGYLLESVHLQGAAMDKNFVVQQWNQPAIEILNVPYQHLANLIRQMCTRNRTRCEEGCRKETVELHEIDRAATKAETKKMDEQETATLNILRTGSAWTKTASSWAGKSDDKRCDLCGDEEDSPDHM